MSARSRLEIADAIQDDFGSTLVMGDTKCAAVAVVDIEKDLEANIELSLLQQRGQATLQGKIQADPKIRFMGGAVGQGSQLHGMRNG